MPNGTKTGKNSVTHSETELKKEMGRRLKELRTGTIIDGRPMTQEQLALKLDELEPDKEHSEKQIGYIERGMRKTSPNYAHLFSKVFHVDFEYFLCESNYKNSAELHSAKAEQFAGVFGQALQRESLIGDLIEAHGYSVNYINKLDNDGFVISESVIIKSASGQAQEMSIEEYRVFRNKINDIVEGLLLLEMQKGKKHG